MKRPFSLAIGNDLGDLGLVQCIKRDTLTDETIKHDKQLDFLQEANLPNKCNFEGLSKYKIYRLRSFHRRQLLHELFA